MLFLHTYHEVLLLGLYYIEETFDLAESISVNNMMKTLNEFQSIANTHNGTRDDKTGYLLSCFLR